MAGHLRRLHSYCSRPAPLLTSTLLQAPVGTSLWGSDAERSGQRLAAKPMSTSSRAASQRGGGSFVATGRAQSPWRSRRLRSCRGCRCGSTPPKRPAPQLPPLRDDKQGLPTPCTLRRVQSGLSRTARCVAELAAFRAARYGRPDTVSKGAFRLGTTADRRAAPGGRKPGEHCPATTAKILANVWD